MENDLAPSTGFRSVFLGRVLPVVFLFIVAVAVSFIFRKNSPTGRTRAEILADAREAKEAKRAAREAESEKSGGDHGGQE